MALSIVLRRSASRVIGGGNRFYANLILPGASVPSLRQFCSSPSLSSKDNESLVGDAKRPSLDESLVNQLISQVQSLQRDIESLRKSYNKPVSTVEEDDEPLVEGEGIDESESIYKGVDDDSSLKGKAIESSNDEGKDSESDKSDEDSNDEGKDSESNESDLDNKDESDDDSNDEGKDSESDKSDDDSSEEDSESDKSDDDSSEEDSNDEPEEDSNEKSSSESDNSNDESLSETDDNNDSDNESDDKSLPKSKENETLLKGIQQEILCAKNFMELSARDATIPVDFPFTIEKDNCGNSSIVLSREYEDELVQVNVQNPTVFTDSNRCGYNERKSSSFSMDLYVLVSCRSSKVKQLELKCGARPEGISIYAAKDPADGIHNQGVHMSEFNENLKEEFGKYLEARGITLSTTNFLYKYMLDKANKERLRILENIEKMVV